jgi:hypothetical protein
MKLTIDIYGMRNIPGVDAGRYDAVNAAGLQAVLAEFSQRRFNAALATALSRTAVQVRDEIRRTMPQFLDRPTRWTLNSLFAKPATAARLQAEVNFKDDRATTGGGTPATYYLLPNVEGGPRRAKRLEVALRAIGALPPGHFAVPAAGARLDAYGNVSRGQIVQILSQLRIQLVAGSNRNMSFDARKQIAAQRRAGGRFFVVRPGEGRQAPGVYQREFLGRNAAPVFIFVRSLTYRRRFRFYDLAEALGRKALPDQVDRAIEQSWARLRAAR